MQSRVQEILAFVGQLAVAGQVPSRREELMEILMRAGFSEADVLAALDRAQRVESASRARASADEPPPPVAQLSEDATRFLHALRDLGYLDDAMEEEVLDLVLDECHGNVGLEDIRGHVAAVIFERQGELDPETQKFLGEEWKIAFH
jgi:hypothetical protein